MGEYAGEQKPPRGERRYPRPWAPGAVSCMAALSLALFGCSGPDDGRDLPEQITTTSGVDSGNSEGTTSQTEIDMTKNSIYFSTDNDPRTGYTTMCFASDRQREYNDYDKSSIITDCSITFCDGSDLVRMDFDSVDFPRPKKGYIGTGDLETQAESLPYLHSRTEVTKNSEDCKGSVGYQLTSPTPSSSYEQKQYACFPTFKRSSLSAMEALKIEKTASTNPQQNNGLVYPRYDVAMSKECFDKRYLH